MNSHMHKVFSTAIVVAVAGCAATPPPTLQTGPEAEVTVDGLVRVDNTVMALVWWKPDMDLTPYTKFMLGQVDVAYQRDPGNRRSSLGADATAGNYALTSQQMRNLKDVFHQSVVEALTEDDGYELTTEPGPDVLRLDAALIDLIVSVPTQQTGVRENTFTRSFGMVTLVLDLRDSQSGEILARGADRRDPTRERGSSGMVRVNMAFVRSDVKRMFDEWANLLREGLDGFRAVPGQ